MYRYALVFGLVTGCLILINAKSLQVLFHTENHWMFVVFAIFMPLYFIMSVNRGRFQGRQEFGKLATTYQTEMWSRLLLTLALLFLIPWEPSFLVALGIGLSFLFGLIPSNFNNYV